jgi:hypothetical protein
MVNVDSARRALNRTRASSARRRPGAAGLGAVGLAAVGAVAAAAVLAGRKMAAMAKVGPDEFCWLQESDECGFSCWKRSSDD